VDLAVGDDAQPVVSVVLCVRNGAATVDRQLAALAAQSFDGRWEIVLVNNASTDATGAVAAAWAARMPRLRVVDEPQVGLNRARNCGVRAAGAPRLALCDDDDKVAVGWLRALVTALCEFDIVGGALEPDLFIGADAPWYHCPQRSELPTLFDRPYAVGANMGFTRRAFDAAGGFDERFTCGADDIDFCLCAQDAGCSIGFVPEARAIYGVKKTVRDIMGQWFRYGQGHQRLVAKHDARGRIRYPPAARWKKIGMNAGSLLKNTPQMLRRSTRYAYLTRLAHVAGEAVELARTPRRDSSGAADQPTMSGSPSHGVTHSS
jgi:glycosyltransferase involved in cell wall biosynthesis